MGYQLIKVPDDPNKPKFSLFSWINGYKAYLVLAASTAKTWYAVYQGKITVDTAIDVTLGLALAAAARSALKTSTAQISNAVVNPASPVAKAVAAQAQPPPA